MALNFSVGEIRAAAANLELAKRKYESALQSNDTSVANMEKYWNTDEAGKNTYDAFKGVYQGVRKNLQDAIDKMDAYIRLLKNKADELEDKVTKAYADLER